MNPRYAMREAFEVVGIEIRTKNADEASGAGKIAKLWETFFAEDVMSKIPHRKPGGPMLAVYSDYESDANGAYSLLVGVEVERIDSLPHGLVTKTVPEAKYAIFTSEKGPVPQIVHDVWKQVWAWAANPSSEGRAYGVDFEVYDERARDPKSAQIEVFVSARGPRLP